MPIRVANNITAINARRVQALNSRDLNKRIERVASGYRINRAADDPAGLSVSEGMRAQILGTQQGVRNIEQGISLVRLAEGALNEDSNILLRMRELAVQSANSTLNNVDRQGLQSEFIQLSQEIDRIAQSTQFNKANVLTGFGNFVNGDPQLTTALDGFNGILDVNVSTAIPSTYTFVDADGQDNQITLSTTLPDGSLMSQTIDLGTSLDRDAGINLVATGTTFVANFDRLGIQITLAGPRVDESGLTLKSTEVTGSGDGGKLIIGEDVIDVPADLSLTEVASMIDADLANREPPGSARYDETLGELQIHTAGHALKNVSGFLNLVPANSFVDGRLDGKSIVIQPGVGGVIQAGPNNEPSHRIGLSISDMRAEGNILNLSGLSIAILESAREAITRLDSAITNVAKQRGILGATLNRMQFTQASLDNSIENLQAAESGIRDADMAEEITALSKSQILNQASVAMIAQANSLPEVVLQLLR